MEFERQLTKDEVFIRKLVELTYSTNQELKLVCCYTLKNLLFKCAKEVRDTIMKELTYSRMQELLDEGDDSENNIRVHEQALIMYRNAVSTADAHEVDTIVNEELFNKLE